MTDRILQMVHFDPATGAIRQVSSTNVYFELEGFTLGELDGMEACQVQPDKWLVDPTTIVERPGLPPLVQLVENPNPPTMESIIAGAEESMRANKLK